MEGQLLQFPLLQFLPHRPDRLPPTAWSNLRPPRGPPQAAVEGVELKELVEPEPAPGLQERQETPQTPGPQAPEAQEAPEPKELKELKEPPKDGKDRGRGWDGLIWFGQRSVAGFAWFCGDGTFG